jgi:hypothetical protein
MLQSDLIERSLALGVDLRYGAANNGTGRIIHGKPASAISADPDIPCFLLLDDPANELFLSLGLGADCILTAWGDSTREESCLLFCVGSLVRACYWAARGNDFLVLRQYRLLDHVPSFSVNRKCNIVLTALARRPVRK